MHQADVRGAGINRGVERFGRAEAANLDLRFGHGAHLVPNAMKSSAAAFGGQV